MEQFNKGFQWFSDILLWLAGVGVVILIIAGCIGLILLLTWLFFDVLPEYLDNKGLK